VVCVPKTLSELMTKAIGACSDFMRDLGLQVVLATGRSHVLAQGYRGHQGVRPARVAAARRTRRAHGGTGAQPRRGFHLKGPVVVEGRTGVLVDGSATPFASVHPEMLPLLKVSAQPNFLLTIENYASFNRQVREIESDGLIVYLGGFLWVSFPRSRHLRPGRSPPGAVAGLVGIECGVVSGVINLESSGVEASDWRPRHDEHYHEA